MAAEITRVPVFAFVKPNEPEMTPEMVASTPSATCTVEFAVIATVLERVPAAVKLMAPAVDAPVPAKFKGSAAFTVAATCSVAPDETVVAPSPEPNAVAVVIETVPLSMVVAPLYELEAPDSVSVFVVPTVFFTWPAPVIFPDKVWSALEAKSKTVAEPSEIAPP